MCTWICSFLNRNPIVEGRKKRKKVVKDTKNKVERSCEREREKTHSHLLILDDDALYQKKKKKRVKIIKWPTNSKRGEEEKKVYIGVCLLTTAALHPPHPEKKRFFLFNYKEFEGS